MEKKRNFWQPAICVVCMVIALFCVGLMWYWNNKGGGVVSVDAFIGVAATFIGVCATIMVGLQIWNYLEFTKVKDRVEYLDNVEEKFSKIEESFRMQASNITRTSNKLSLDISSIYNTMAINSDDNELKSMYLIFSITANNWTSDRVLNENFNEMEYDKYVKLNGAIDKLETANRESISAHLKLLLDFHIPNNTIMYDEISELHFSIINKMKRLCQYKKLNNIHIHNGKDENGVDGYDSTQHR